MKTNFIHRISKATALAAFMFFALTMSAFAKPTSDVSKQVMKHFAKRFTNATNVTWKTTEAFTSASCTINGESVQVYYDNFNSLIGVSKIITVNDLPQPAQQTLESLYKNYKVNSVIDFTEADGTLQYYIQLEKHGQEIILRSDEYGHISLHE